MALHSFFVANRRDASKLIASGAPFQAVIGIGWLPGEDPFIVPCPPGVVSHTMLANDVLFPDLVGAPTRFVIENLLGFFPKIRGPLLVHCEAGWSRSPAVALLYIAWALGPGNEEKAVERLYAEYPNITPNERIVALGDRLMARNRRLFDAVLERANRAQYPVIQAVYDGVAYTQLGRYYST